MTDQPAPAAPEPDHTAYSEGLRGAEYALEQLREKLNERQYDRPDDDEITPGYEAALTDLRLFIDKLKKVERTDQWEDRQRSIRNAAERDRQELRESGMTE